MAPSDALTVLTALATYRRRIVPIARAELRRWEERAAEIPDPLLREAALSALRDKGSNVEATAVFAILAPRGRRGPALRAMTALQAATDYLDALSEQPADDPLANGLALHGALCDAVSPGGAPGDWYRLHPQRDDGGYLAALVAGCRGALAELPAADAARPHLLEAARRCADGQSHTHAAARLGTEGFEAWAERQRAPGGYMWWEVAAGASSSVAAHALIAAAADSATSGEEAALIDALYFPSVGALTVLLDDLVDREDDLAAGEHNYLTYYANNEIAAERISGIARCAAAAAGRLRQASRHRAILVGVAGYYLSTPAARSGYARPIRKRLLEALDPSVRPIMVAMRLRSHG